MVGALVVGGAFVVVVLETTVVVVGVVVVVVDDVVVDVVEVASEDVVDDSITEVVVSLADPLQAATNIAKTTNRYFTTFLSLSPSPAYANRSALRLRGLGLRGRGS